MLCSSHKKTMFTHDENKICEVKFVIGIRPYEINKTNRLYADDKNVDDFKILRDALEKKYYAC